MNGNYSQATTGRRRKTRPSSQTPPCENIPPPPLHTLSLFELLKRPAPQYSWLVDPLLPSGGVMGLAGEPGTAKTWLVLELAQAVATGRPFLQRFATRQGPVLIIDEENGETRLQRRLARLTGGKLEDCPVHIASMCGVNLSQEQWIDSLHDKMTRLKPQLTVLDSLVRMHRGEENSAQDIARLFSVLTVLRNDFGSAIVFTHHLRKQGFVRDMGQRIRGSSDILAYVDSMLGMSKIETAFTLSHIKNRDGDCVKSLSLVVEDTDDTTTAIRVIGEVDEEGGKREQARALIMDALEDGDRFRDELTAIASDAGIGSRTFAQALKELEATRLIVGSFENRRKKYSTFAVLQSTSDPLQKSQESPPTSNPQANDTPDNPTFALLQPLYKGVQILQKSSQDDDPPGDTGENPTFAVLPPTHDPLQKSQGSPPTNDPQANATPDNPTFALLQPLYKGVQILQKSSQDDDPPGDTGENPTFAPLQLGLDTAHHSQESPPPEPELTDAEKHALAGHWRNLNCPPLTLGKGLYFNLRALLYTTDPYLARKRLEHAARLRRLLARWENPDAPASHNEDGGET